MRYTHEEYLLILSNRMPSELFKTHKTLPLHNVSPRNQPFTSGIAIRQALTVVETQALLESKFNVS